jgi:hypothetical protein
MPEAKPREEIPGSYVYVQHASLAERKGFEPLIDHEPIHAFQACPFNHSGTSPQERSMSVATWGVYVKEKGS